jgi:hypothetical protein
MGFRFEVGSGAQGLRTMGLTVPNSSKILNLGSLAESSGLNDSCLSSAREGDASIESV